MVPHVNEAAAAAQLGVLAEGARNGRVPAGQLGPAHDQRAQVAGLDHLLERHMAGVIAHHEVDAQLHTHRLAVGDHLVTLLQRQRQRLLAEDVLARRGRVHDLAVVQMRRGGDVDRLHARVVEYLFHGLVCVGIVLGPAAQASFLADVLDSDKVGVRTGYNAFRDGPAVSDAPAADYSPVD